MLLLLCEVLFWEQDQMVGEPQRMLGHLYGCRSNIRCGISMVICALCKTGPIGNEFNLPY